MHQTVTRDIDPGLGSNQVGQAARQPGLVDQPGGGDRPRVLGELSPLALEFHSRQTGKCLHLGECVQRIPQELGVVDVVSTPGEY